MFGMEKLEWCGGCQTVKKLENMITRFNTIHEHDGQKDERTDTARRHRPRLCVASCGQHSDSMRRK